MALATAKSLFSRPGRLKALFVLTELSISKERPHPNVPFSKQRPHLFPGTNFFVFEKKVQTLGNFHRNDSVSGGLVGEDTQIAGSRLAVLTTATFTLVLLLGSALSGNGQDKDLRISCRLRILRPALRAAVATSQLVATTDAEYHGRTAQPRLQVVYSLALLLSKNRSRRKKDKKNKTQVRDKVGVFA